MTGRWEQKERSTHDPLNVNREEKKGCDSRCPWKGFFSSDSNLVIDQSYLQPARRRCTYDSSMRMHQKSSLLIFAVLLVISEGRGYPVIRPQEGEVMKKCCPEGHVFDEDLKCVRISGAVNTSGLAWRNESESEFLSSLNYISLTTYGCPEDVGPGRNSQSHSRRFVPGEYCIDLARNGTEITVRCSALKFLDNSSSPTRSQQGMNHRWDFNGVIFWGAQTYQTTNLAHMVLCMLVVVVYLVLPELGKGLYNRAVLRHNICLLANGSILFFLGYYECPMNDNVAIFVWLCLQYFTVATVFWLNVICFDMTLAITRFRWMLGRRDDREENRKLFLYGVFAWIGPLLPTGLAGLMDYCPGIPEDFPLKPNYPQYRNGAHPVVNLYFFVIPLFTLFCNNVLFVFTTYKILRIRRTTKIATANQSSTLRKEYFLFLRLYLLMGAPWFFGLLLACLNKLALLKICRLIQPVLWILMLLTHKAVRLKVIAKLSFLRPSNDQPATTNRQNGNPLHVNPSAQSVISTISSQENLSP